MHRHPFLALAALSLTVLTSCHISHRGMDFSPLTDRFEPAKDDEVVLEGDTTSISTPVATPPDVAFNTPAPAAAPAPVAEPTPIDPFSVASAPTPALPPTPAPAPAIVPALGSDSYVVKAGDTLGAIARRSHSTVPQLCAANGLQPTSTLKIGQKLRLPAAGSTPAATAAAKPAAKPAAKAAAKASGKARVHTVQAGETLYAVARKHNVSPAALMQANKLTPQTASKLRIGSTLTIPAK